MIFDQLCGIAERHIPWLVPTLQETKIFKFEGIPHIVMNNAYAAYTDNELNDMFDNFFLPYRYIAIEDGASCMLIMDTKPNQIGLGSKRLCLEIMPVDRNNQFVGTKVDWESFGENEEVKEIERQKKCIIIFGAATGKFLDRDKLLMEGHVNKMLFGNKHEVDDLTYSIKDNEDFVNKNSLQNMISAFHQLIYFNRPSKFILKETPVKQPKKIPSDRILRSNQRPIYTILKPDEIRRRMGLSNPHIKGRRKKEHERRRHWRYLSDEIYNKDKNGDAIKPKIIPSGDRRGQPYYKKIDIPAIWVGQSENKVGNKIYKVMLNK